MRLMKTCFLLILFLIIFIIQALPEEKIPIAIMNFKVTNLPAAEVDLLIDFFNNALFETGYFDVLQRDKRDKLLSEIEFSLSDAADAKKTRQLGKLLSSKLVVFGSIGKLGNNIVFNTTVADVDTGKTMSTFSRTYKNLDAIVDDLPQISISLSETATQSMFLKKTNVIYYQDFQTQNWPISANNYFKGGQYHLHSTERSWYIQETQIFDDFAMEGEMNFVEGSKDGGFGLLFRMQDENNCYIFIISNDQKFTVLRYLNSEYKFLIPWTPHTAVNPNKKNIIKVVAVRDQFNFYINNVIVNQKPVRDATFRSGKFGPYTYPNVHAAFSRLIIYQGNLIFYDYFSRPSENFSEGEGAYTKDGAYLIDGKKWTTPFFSWTGISYKNVSIKADAVWREGDANHGYGITFRLQDAENNYIFWITKSGFYSFGYYKDNVLNMLVDWKKSRIINQEGKNILRVECLDDTFSLYLNENLVETVSDGTYRNGKIGFMTSQGVNSAFDNVELFLLE